MLKRENKIKNISDKLTWFMMAIKTRGYQHLLDANTISEDFVAQLLNIVYGYKLRNLNHIHPNKSIIDLDDTTNRIAFQVTSENNRKKIQNTIDAFVEKGLYKTYTKLNFMILSVSYNPRTEFTTNGKFFFEKNQNIIDLRRLLLKINCLETAKLTEIENYLIEEISIDNDSKDKEKDRLTSLAADFLKNLENFRSSNPKAVELASGVPYRNALTELRKSYVDWELYVLSWMVDEEQKEIRDIGQRRLGMKNLAKGEEIMRIMNIVMDFTGHAIKRIQDDQSLPRSYKKTRKREIEREFNHKLALLQYEFTHKKERAIRNRDAKALILAEVEYNQKVILAKQQRIIDEEFSE